MFSALTPPSAASLIGAGILALMPRGGLAQEKTAAESTAGNPPSAAAALDPSSGAFSGRKMTVEDIARDPASLQLMRFTLKGEDGVLRKFVRRDGRDEWQITGWTEKPRLWRGRINISAENEICYRPDLQPNDMPKEYWQVCRPDGGRFLLREADDGTRIFRDLAGRLFRVERADGLRAEYQQERYLTRMEMGRRSREFSHRDGLLETVVTRTPQGVVSYRFPPEIARQCTIHENGQVIWERGGRSLMVIPPILPCKADHDFQILAFEMPRYRGAGFAQGQGSKLDEAVAHSSRVIGNGDRDDPATRAHETVHRINNDISLALGNRPQFYNGRIGVPNQVEGVWLGSGIGTMLKAPAGITLRDVEAAVPGCLRGRNAFYFGFSKRAEGAQMYLATFVCDEGSAFIQSAEAALELPRHYGARGSFGFEIANAGEFTGYILALGCCIAHKEDAYSSEKDRVQALGVIKRLVERSALAYNAGLSSEYAGIFSGERRDYLALLRDDFRAKDLRDFAVNTYGEDWWAGIVGSSGILDVRSGG